MEDTPPAATPPAATPPAATPPAAAPHAAPPFAAPLRPATLAVAAGRPPRDPGAPLNPPVVLASTFVAGGETTYGRFGNPTWSAFEAAVGALEGGAAIAFASGMAAVSAVLDVVPGDGVVVAPDHAYSGSLALLDSLLVGGRIGAVRRVHVADADAVARAASGAALVWMETPTNPALEVADLRAAATAARHVGALLAVDNTFATPLGQRPLDLGADVVVHSATKFLAGHSDVLLGVAVTRDPALQERLTAHRTAHGAVPGSFDAWLALRGLRTLHLRLERAQATAEVLARRLHDHPRIVRVRYPGLPDDPGHALAAAQMNGFGAVVCAEVAGGAGAAEALAERVRLWVHATSLGGVESTLERRRRWPAEAATIPPGLVRLSVGCEDVEDLWADLSAALASLPAP